METGDTQAPNTALLVTTVNALAADKMLPFQDAIVFNKQLSMRLMLRETAILQKSKAVPSEFRVGIQGMKHSVKVFPDPSTYRITYRPMMNSKDQNIANTIQAGAQQGIFPRRFILEKTMGAQDPDQLIRELRMDAAERVDPSIGMIQMALAYAKEAQTMTGLDADEANTMSMSLTDSAVTLIKQREMAQSAMAPEQPQSQEPAKPNMQGMVALAGPSRGGM
jgi:hypothetical protein